MTLDIMFAEILGPENVVRTENGTFVTHPATADELAELVRLAREHRFALAPEGAESKDNQAVLVSFDRMKSIMHISRRNRSAVFGAGVTFGELIPAVDACDLVLNIPLCPRATDSVVQSMLRRTPVIMPKFHWDSADPLGCLEVVFGTGEIFRTGAAAGPGTLEEQWDVGASQVEPSGPAASSWYRLVQGSFGTMGLVTWASTRCEAKPTLQKAYIATADDWTKLVDFVQQTLYLRKGSECFILERNQLSALLKKQSGEVPEWAALINLTACELLPEQRIQGESKDLFALAKTCAVTLSESCGTVRAETLRDAARTPGCEPYWKDVPRGTYREVFFTCGQSNVCRYVNAARNVLERAGISSQDIGIYIQPQVQGANWSCGITIYCADAEAGIQQAEAGILELTRRLIALGAYFVTPCACNEQVVMQQNESVLQALRKIKEVVDPDHVLNPGKICL